MDKGEYLTVAQVAEITGMTPQAVYKRIDGNLKPYLKVLNNKKHLHRDVLKIFGSTDSINVENDRSTGSTTGNENLTEIIAALNRTIGVLSHQLAAKDKQINDLNDSLKLALNNQAMQHYTTVKQIGPPKQSFIDRVFRRDKQKEPENI